MKRSWPVNKPCRCRHNPIAATAAALFLLAALASRASHAANCEPVGTTPANGHFIGGVVPSGKYCLTVNLKQPKEFDLHAMRFKTFVGAPLLSISCPSWDACARSVGTRHVDIDLQGHRITADVANMTGIQDRVPTEHISLRNGSVIVGGTRAGNIGIDLQAMYSPRKTYARLNCKQAGVKCGNGQLVMVAPEAPVYLETRHIVERVKVRAGWLGVQMVGIGNTLRNSVVDVDNHTATALFGFGSIIENNTIIVHGKERPASEDGALALWDAKGAVIRNNRFIYKGRAKHAPPAIRLVDSAGVTLEGNAFEGFTQVLAQTGNSSHTEKK